MNEIEKKLMSSVDIKARQIATNRFRDSFEKVIKAIVKGDEPVLIIPKRTLSNTIYDKERGLLLLGSSTFERSFLDVKEARKFMQTTLMARIIYEALVSNEYPTIRDLYYRGKHSIRYRDHRNHIVEENTWDEQKESDAVLRDIEVYVNLLREEMLILSKEKGKVVGDMRIKSGDDIIDLSRMGHGAYAIESTPDLIEFIDVNVEFVLVVEKDAVFQQLHRAGFWKKYKAILVTSAGQPDRATRRFVKRLNEELKLPVYILTDADPYGWYIYSVFRIGSITLSYESERLATSSAKFLGVSMSDIFGDKSTSKKPYLTESERKNFIIKAKKTDIKRAQELLNYEWFKTEKWTKEIKIFLEKQSKLEIEALTGKGLYFLMDNYIPTKIETKDFIE